MKCYKCNETATHVTELVNDLFYICPEHAEWLKDKGHFAAPLLKDSSDEAAERI